MPDFPSFGVLSSVSPVTCATFLKCLFGSVHWCNRLILHLQCQHPIWALVRVLAAPLAIQISAYELGNFWEWLKLLDLCTHVWRTGKKLLPPDFGWGQLWPLWPLQSEPTNEDLFLSLVLSEIFLSNESKSFKTVKCLLFFFPVEIQKNRDPLCMGSLPRWLHGLGLGSLSQELHAGLAWGVLA